MPTPSDPVLKEKTTPERPSAILHADTPMMQQFNAIKREHTDKILFFRMGDFYEMFGDDAVVAAKVLQIALTSRNKKNKENSIPMCGVPYHAYEQYLNKLTAAGYKVAICEQIENPAEAQGIVKRDVVRVVTPGTTVSPQLINPDRNHYLIAIHIQLQRKQLGVALVDISTGEFEVVEFSINEMPQIYDFIFQILPEEILFSQSQSALESEFLENLTQQIERLLGKTSKQASFNFIDAYYFDQDASEKLLQKHFKTLNLSGFGVNKLKLSLSAAGALLRYLQETQKCDLHHITRIKQHSFEKFMLLDETTISNLELFDSPSGQAKNTLFGVMKQTNTAMGARLLRQWLRQPLLDIAAINTRFDSIDELHHNFILCEELRTVLKQIQDIPRIAGRVSLPIVGINDVVGLRESLIPIAKLPNYLEHFQASLLHDIAKNFDPLEDISQLLHTQLLEEPATKLREGKFIADGVSGELDELRNLSSNTKNILNEMIEAERQKTGVSALKIGFNKVFGYYLEVSNTHKKELPDYYIRKQTLVNAERYITPELKELEEKILGAEERICELEYELFQELKQKLVSQISRIQRTSRDIAVVDALSSLAFIAENNNYIRPKLYPLGAFRKIKLLGSRHPVIEQIDFDEPFIPNDIELNEENQQIMLITGPNMAGKSTVMRQVALNILMAQCGSYVPANSADLTIQDRVFTRVGASDNLSQGESTFMVEMNEAAAILNNATERSLIILDEIGRGTSTFDGISLAWAIVEHLHDLGSLTMCATHYHEMTAISQQLNRVKNFNILVKEEKEHIVFMRKIVSGEADKSYGVHVAKLAGLPASVVRRAMEVMVDLESSSFESHLPKPPSNSVAEPEPVFKKATDTNEDSTCTQLNLFPEKPTYLQELKELDLNNMTPMESLMYLHDLINRLKYNP